ncbi:phenylacetate-CoA oxygenase/reductase subunit PaaK [soil metagenome]
MAAHFHSLKIKDIRKETADCVSISFDIPETLAGLFDFKEGQNITIRKNINGQEIRRSYSVCAAPHEKELRVAVKKVAGGLFSKFANEVLKKGDSLEVLPPTGKFNAKLHAGETGDYLAIAAGSGITPVLSIIKHTLASQPGSRFTLVYGNRNRNSIIFFEELEGLKNSYMERFSFINILSRERTDTEIFYGRINEQKLIDLEKLLPYENFDEIYLCGPEELIFTANDYFQQKGIGKEHIHFELFTTPGQKKSATTIIEAQTSTGPKSNITIKLDGRSFDFNLGFSSNSILDAALQQGADLPYACKGGVCATCRAKLVEGEVAMDVNYALEQEEVEQGFILTCQSHPRTEKVVVDFDIK